MRAPHGSIKEVPSAVTVGPRGQSGSTPAKAGSEDGRWKDRPLLAGGLRVVAFAVPLAASLTAAWLLARALPEPTTTGGRVTWWLAVAAMSLITLVAVDHLARRLLPLAALLKLSMAFPDRAPSRLGVALRSGSTKRLQDRAVHDLQEGKQEPAEAARTILSLAASINAHDRGTRGHSERVRAYADLIAEELDLSPEERDRLRWAALLHDLGKLSVPATTLNSHEALTSDDWEVLRRHPLEGARLAASLKGWLGPWALAIEQHHERYDGTGYPYGLSGEDLSLAARIVAVADTFDAMTAVRSYSSGVAPAAARMELAKKAGTDFDPAVVRAFLNVGLGRVRWVMGPFAFFSLLPFAPGLGGLRHVVTESGRTVALGTVSLVAATGLVAPIVDNDPTPAQVLGEQVVRPAPRAVRTPPPLPLSGGVPFADEVPGPVEIAGAETPPDAVAETLARISVLPTPSAAPVRPRPTTSPPSPPAPPANVPGPTAAAPAATAPAATAPEPTSTAPTSTAPTSPAPSAPPDPTPTTPPAAEETPPPPPDCRRNEHANDKSGKCPPRWGHSDDRPPKAQGPPPTNGRPL